MFDFKLKMFNVHVVKIILFSVKKLMRKRWRFYH